MPLSVTEKQHWRDAIARRITGRIEAIQARHPALFDRVRRAAHAQALESLGVAETYATLEQILAEEKDLARRKKQAQRAMLAALRGVPIDEVGDSFRTPFGVELPVPADVAEAITRRQAAHQAALLADDPVGQQIARLEVERENLLNTVFLACSTSQIKQLWSKVGELLGEAPTPLEREALAIEPVAES